MASTSGALHAQTSRGGMARTTMKTDSVHGLSVLVWALPRTRPAINLPFLSPILSHRHLESVSRSPPSKAIILETNGVYAQSGGCLEDVSLPVIIVIADAVTALNHVPGSKPPSAEGTSRKHRARQAEVPTVKAAGAVAAIRCTPRRGGGTRCVAERGHDRPAAWRAVRAAG